MSPNRRPKGEVPTGMAARNPKGAPLRAPGRANARIPQHTLGKEAP